VLHGILGCCIGSRRKSEAYKISGAAECRTVPIRELVGNKQRRLEEKTVRAAHLAICIDSKSFPALAPPSRMFHRRRGSLQSSSPAAWLRACASHERQGPLRPKRKRRITPLLDGCDRTLTEDKKVSDTRNTGFRNRSLRSPLQPYRSTKKDGLWANSRVGLPSVPPDLSKLAESPKGQLA